MTISEATWNELKDYRDSLEHYGVKGMKWGVQKKRKTTGRKRTYSEKTKKRREQRAKKRVERAKARAEKQAADAKRKAEKAAAKKEKRRKEILNNPTKLYKHRREFSAQEIQDAMKQFEWEKKLGEYSKNQLSNGAEFINTMFKYANNSINLYNAAARIVNAFNEESNMPYIYPMGQNKKDKDKD